MGNGFVGWGGSGGKWAGQGGGRLRERRGMQGQARGRWARRAPKASHNGRTHKINIYSVTLESFPRLYLRTVPTFIRAVPTFINGYQCRAHVCNFKIL